MLYIQFVRVLFNLNYKSLQILFDIVGGLVIAIEFLFYDCLLIDCLQYFMIIVKMENTDIYNDSL